MSLDTRTPERRRYELHVSLPARVFAFSFALHLLFGLAAVLLQERLRLLRSLLLLALPLLIVFVPYWFFLLFNTLGRLRAEQVAALFTRLALWLVALVCLALLSVWLLALLQVFGLVT